MANKKLQYIFNQYKLIIEADNAILNPAGTDVDYQLEEGKRERHKVGIDCVSLLDDDGETISAEDEAVGREMYFTIIKSLDTDRERFIAIALDMGFDNFEIADMLCLHPSQITRGIQKIRIKLLAFRNARKT